MSVRKMSGIIIVLLGLIGCTHSVHLYHVSDSLPYNSSKNYRRIWSSSKQLVVLDFAFNTNYVNEAFLKLQKKCPSGRIANIHTRYSTSHGFFSWTNKIQMRAICFE